MTIIRIVAKLAFVGALWLTGAATAGTLSLDKASYQVGEVITGTYATDQPNDLNWLGLYHQPGNAPVNGSYVGASTEWIYSPGTSGAKTLPTADLPPGHYVVYYLYNDGYAALAPPVEFDVVPRQTDQSLAFLAAVIGERNARAGDAYAGSVRGGACAATGAMLTYAKSAGPAWLAVAANGDLSGTPAAADAGDNTFTLTVSDGNGASATTTLAIRVRAAGEPLADTLRVMSFNAWQGGSHVDAGREKQRRVMFAGRVDVVGIQEDEAGTGETLAASLGWYRHAIERNLSIVSRYPIVGDYRAELGGGVIAIGARVRVAAEPLQEIVVWTTQLAYSPYGPYDACYNDMDASQLVTRETQSGRVAATNAILAAMQTQLADSALTDVFLTGDFNAPSHLDWTEATSASHCGKGAVSWPATLAIEQAGLVDTYRAKHPDPATDAGNTWSPVRPAASEPQDRIDYVFHAGDDWHVDDAQTLVLGTPAAMPNVQSNEWPSDHAAVVTTFVYAPPGDVIFADSFDGAGER